MIVLEILPNDVYFENEKKDSSYISFNKARTIIFKDLPKIIKYSCVDSKRSVDFLNLLLTKYKVCNKDYLQLKRI